MPGFDLSERNYADWVTRLRQDCLQRQRSVHLKLSAAAAWRALETVRVVELELGQRRKRCVTRGSRQAAEVLRLLGLRQQLDPPPPPAGQETIM